MTKTFPNLVTLHRSYGENFARIVNIHHRLSNCDIGIKQFFWNSKFLVLNITYFWQKCFVSVLMIFGTNFGHFCDTKVNEMKPRAFYAQRSPIFSLNLTHHPFWNKIWMKLHNILQKIARNYNLIWNPMIVNRTMR